MKKKKFLAILIMAGMMTALITACGSVSGTDAVNGGSENVAVNNDENTDSDDGTFGIKDTLSLEEAVENLHWFYTLDDLDTVYGVTIGISANGIETYSNSYTTYGSDVYYNMEFTGLVNGNESDITIKFDTESIDDYKEDNSFRESMYDDYVFYEDQYSDCSVMTSTHSSCVTIYKEVDTSYYLIVEIEKASSGDDLADYEAYYQTFIDSLTVKKYSKDDFSDTTYLTLYPQGWYSSGGGHLYLDSTSVTVGDLVLNLEGFSAAAINDSMLIGTPWSGCYDYAVKVMKDTPIYVETWDEEDYFDFEIYYISDESSNEIMDYLSNEEAYAVSTETVNGHDFVFYEALTSDYEDYYMYKTEGGYYLFGFGGSTYSIIPEYQDEFAAILV